MGKTAASSVQNRKLTLQLIRRKLTRQRVTIPPEIFNGYSWEEGHRGTIKGPDPDRQKAMLVKLDQEKVLGRTYFFFIQDIFDWLDEPQPQFSRAEQLASQSILGIKIPDYMVVEDDAVLGKDASLPAAQGPTDVVAKAALRPDVLPSVPPLTGSKRKSDEHEAAQALLFLRLAQQTSEQQSLYQPAKRQSRPAHSDGVPSPAHHGGKSNVLYTASDPLVVSEGEHAPDGADQPDPPQRRAISSQPDNAFGQWGSRGERQLPSSQPAQQFTGETPLAGQPCARRPAAPSANQQQATEVPQGDPAPLGAAHPATRLPPKPGSYVPATSGTPVGMPPATSPPATEPAAEPQGTAAPPALTLTDSQQQNAQWQQGGAGRPPPPGEEALCGGPPVLASSAFQPKVLQQDGSQPPLMAVTHVDEMEARAAAKRLGLPPNCLPVYVPVPLHPTLMRCQPGLAALPTLTSAVQTVGTQTAPWPTPQEQQTPPDAAYLQQRQSQAGVGGIGPWGQRAPLCGDGQQQQQQGQFNAMARQRVAGYGALLGGWQVQGGGEEGAAADPQKYLMLQQLASLELVQSQQAHPPGGARSVAALADKLLAEKVKVAVAELLESYRQSLFGVGATGQVAVPRVAGQSTAAAEACAAATAAAAATATSLGAGVANNAVAGVVLGSSNVAAREQPRYSNDTSPTVTRQPSHTQGQLVRLEAGTPNHAPQPALLSGGQQLNGGQAQYGQGPKPYGLQPVRFVQATQEMLPVQVQGDVNHVEGHAAQGIQAPQGGNVPAGELHKVAMDLARTLQAAGYFRGAEARVC